MTSQPTHGESAEMYLKSLAELGGDQRLTPISSLADRLGISPVSATEMIHRLVERGLVKHTPYKGVKLSKKGKSIAYRIIRRQRLWECFMAEELGIAWDRVYDLACQMEHAVGEEVTEALAARLGDPPLCPHGNPIPSLNGKLSPLPLTPLSEVQPQVPFTLQRITPVSGTVLTALANHNLKPGLRAQITTIDPLEGLRTLEVGGHTVVMGTELASHLHVNLEADGPSPGQGG